MYPTNDTLDNQERVRSSKNNEIGQYLDPEFESRNPNKIEGDDGERRDERISTNLPKMGWHKGFLEWRKCGERERKKSGRRRLERGTEKKRREEGERNRGGADRSTDRKPVQPVIRPVQPVSGQTAQ